MMFYAYTYLLRIRMLKPESELPIIETLLRDLDTMSKSDITDLHVQQMAIVIM